MSALGSFRTFSAVLSNVGYAANFTESSARGVLIIVPIGSGRVNPRLRAEQEPIEQSKLQLIRRSGVRYGMGLAIEGVFVTTTTRNNSKSTIWV